MTEVGRYGGGEGGRQGGREGGRERAYIAWLQFIASKYTLACVCSYAYNWQPR